MGFKKAIVCLLLFGVAVLLIQMLALSNLNVQGSSKRPWEEASVSLNTGIKEEYHPAGPQVNNVGRNLASESPPQNVNVPRFLKKRDNLPEKKTDYLSGPKNNNNNNNISPAVPNPVQFMKDLKNRVLQQAKSTNSSEALSRSPSSPLSLTPIDKKPKLMLAVPNTGSLQPRSLTPYPLPPDLGECNLTSKKDATSAISRAKTQECKDLIRNVTCLQQGGRLYNTAIRNKCPLGRYPGKAFQKIPYSHGSGPNARVVYLMSIHGRAYRQVKRLFKAVYHTDHYFFIHVDSRSDYLHRKLYEELSDFSNVYFPSWRMATIWGGASLLQMLLRSMEDLEFTLTDWTWDYLINLSESDFPLKTNEELVKFLRVHRGKNFVKTHGGDINKFIQKQGLDRTFVECDNHMWRVDHRPLPQDLIIDGGSDWIAIHRNYSRYLITNKDPFLTGLKRYYEFSLLPAESFFHTVLRNGPMCSLFVKTNLRVTNWNRKLGCRCQYKHIVDWCGCSPNDFLAQDFSRLKSVGDHHFFARKFEAMVNQEIINRLDGHLYGHYPPSTAALNSYWESVYHIEDDVTKPSNARYSTYLSFMRQSLKLLYSEQAEKSGGGGGSKESPNCGIPRNAIVKDVNVYRQNDALRGLLITLKDSLSTALNPPQFEVFFSPVSGLKKFDVEGDFSKRILGLEVGSDWDGKESVFRNYGSILGAWDEPVAALRLKGGIPGEVNIIWDDPVGERISTFLMKIEASWFVSYHKPKVERPIRPGLWTVTVQLQPKNGGAILMQNQFLVVPITHENKQPLANPISVNAKRTVTVKPSMDIKEFTLWKKNVSKTGEQLEGWMDSLVARHWNIEGYCRTSMEESPSECSWIPDCSTTSWSSFSSDPKSELGEIQPNGRIR